MEKEKYINKIENEIKAYKNITNVHELPNIHIYVGHKYLKYLLMSKCKINSHEDLILEKINIIKKRKHEKDITICSLGSGNCDYELNLAKRNKLKCNFIFYEVNAHMLKRGQEMAESYKMTKQTEFIECDINSIKLNRQYDIILAVHSLHHFVELELIFDEVSKSLDEDSFFLINDMIGRNGHMFWKNTREIVNRLWLILPDELKYNRQMNNKFFSQRYQTDYRKGDGFEGIRAQDILPLLDKKFNFEVFASFFSIMNRFIDRDFGHNFDSGNDYHRSIIEMIWYMDDNICRNHLLKPTQMIASLVKKNVAVNNDRYTYFQKPSDLYNLNDSAVFDAYSNKENIYKMLSKDFLAKVNNKIRKIFLRLSSN